MSRLYILNELNISIVDKKKDEEYISKLNTTEDKVKYLRIIKKYTQENTAEMIGISSRQVRRIEKILKKT